MIRIAITVEAFEAIVAALPFGTVAYELEPNANGERLIWLEEVWINKLDAPYACPASRTATSSCGSPSLRRPKDSFNGSRGQSGDRPSDSPGAGTPDMSRSLTYAEMAGALKITPESANRLAQEVPCDPALRGAPTMAAAPRPWDGQGRAGGGLSIVLLRIGCRAPARSNRVAGLRFCSGGAHSSGFSGVAGLCLARRQFRFALPQGLVRGRCRMWLQLLCLLRIARRDDAADARRKEDGQNRTFHPTSPTVSFRDYI